MTIGLRALIGLEKSATKALRAAIEPPVNKLTGDIHAAMQAGNQDAALKLLESFDLTQHVSKVGPLLEEIALSTAIFGAAQLKPAHQTLFVAGKRHRMVFKAAKQMQTMTAQMGTKRIRLHGVRAITAKSDTERRMVVRKSFYSLCCPGHTLDQMFHVELLKADAGSNVIHLAKAAIPADQMDISDALNAATMGNGRLSADVGANLTTTRLASYGFLAQAQADGVGRYQITAELDERTCPVCMYMHGKTLDVNSALDQTEAALNTDNPDDIGDIAPWPGQSSGDMVDLLQMDPEELQAQGYMVPPFHPACRCVLQEDGTVDQTLAPESPDEAAATVAGDESGNWFTKLLDLLTGNVEDNPNDPLLEDNA